MMSSETFKGPYWYEMTIDISEDGNLLQVHDNVVKDIMVYKFDKIEEVMLANLSDEALYKLYTKAEKELHRRKKNDKAK